MRMMRSKLHLDKLLIFVMVAGLGLLSSCYPDDDITVSESDIIMTTKDDSVDFNQIMTYYMPDKVFVVDTSDEEEPIEYEDLILGEIANNMQAYGYERIMDTVDAENNIDVVLIATAYKTTVTSIWYPYYPYYPGWDDWYWWSPGWGYYPPGWGYYPPGWGYYPPYVSQYTVGTVKIDMLDPWKPDEIAPDTIVYPTYWMAAIQGLLQGSNIDDRIKEDIQKAFELSPYLDHK
jgi:hypothetical protein